MKLQEIENAIEYFEFKDSLIVYYENSNGEYDLDEFKRWYKYIYPEFLNIFKSVIVYDKSEGEYEDVREINWDAVFKETDKRDIAEFILTMKNSKELTNFQAWSKSIIEIFRK